MNLSVATFLQTHLENEWLLYFFQLRILALRNFLWLTCSHVLRRGDVLNIQSLCLLHTEVEYSMAFSVVGGFSMGTRSCYIILREYTFSLTLDNTNPTALSSSVPDRELYVWSNSMCTVSLSGWVEPSLIMESAGITVSSIGPHVSYSGYSAMLLHRN